MVKDIGAKDVLVNLKTTKGSYTLPLGQIKLDQKITALGDKVNLADVKIDIQIANVPTSRQSEIKALLTNRSSKMIGEPLAFDVSLSYGDKTITIDQFDQYVEREIALPDNISLEDVSTAVKVGNDGSLTHVPTKIIERDGKLYARISSMTNSVYTLIYNDKPMTDITGHWAASDIQDMVSRFIINGTSEGVFEPSRNITRAELTAVIVNALGIKSDTTTQEFTDVQEGKWYYNVVQSAAAHGLISGYQDGSFMPNAVITREETMAIIARTIDFIGQDQSVDQDQAAKLLAKFTDNKDISNWAQTAVATSVKNDIAKGYEGKIMPKSPITRAESVVMIRRLMKISDLI